MRTYSEAEIEEYVRKTLEGMPWASGKAPITAPSSARFMVVQVLRRQGIRLDADGFLRNSRGHRIGMFGSAKWVEDTIEWTYMPTGGRVYVVATIRIGDIR